MQRCRSGGVRSVLGQIRKMLLILGVFLCGAALSDAKTSFSLNIPALRPFRQLGDEDDGSLPIKAFSGRRVRDDSIRMIYSHDQTIAIVELQPDRLLLNCELIEVYEPSDAMRALGVSDKELYPVPINFNEMATLMNQCEQLEEGRLQGRSGESAKNYTRHSISGRGIFANNPLVLFSGIIPGTKWCGTGDIARDYYDLGTEPRVDKCCRAHDLCPVKIRSTSNRYNLTNESFYTKSHCLCDDRLYDCLRDSNSRTAYVMGNIYFNAVQIPCIEDTEKGRRYRKAKSNF